MRTLICFFALMFAVSFADEQLTIHKVTVNTPSGVISGKVIGTGDKLVFVDDANPSRSFSLSRGEIANYRSETGGVLVELARPVRDEAGTVSNLRITVVDPENAAALTRWISMPVERARSVTTHSLDARHDHKGKGHCRGKLMADDTTLRFESVTEANHSRTWNYNDLQTFDKERDNSLLKVTAKNGESYHFNVENGATAGAMYDVVADKIVAARPAR